MKGQKDLKYSSDPDYLFCIWCKFSDDVRKHEMEWVEVEPTSSRFMRCITISKGEEFNKKVRHEIKLPTLHIANTSLIQHNGSRSYYVIILLPPIIIDGPRDTEEGQAKIGEVIDQYREALASIDFGDGVCLEDFNYS